MSLIGELARRSGFKGSPNHRIAEPQKIQNLTSIDTSMPGSPTIRTSIDTYVSGQYAQNDGSLIEVTQRYTVFVAYSKGTQMKAMQRVRSRIADDFQNRYGSVFNITTVHIPDVPVPTQANSDDDMRGQGPEPAGPMEFYGGSQMFREMTRFEKARFDIGTEREKAKRNIDSIRDRYGMRR